MAEDTTKTDEETLEDFTTINPEDLAPELKTLYKSMQADYTRKTQDIAARTKEYADREAVWEEKVKAYGAAEQELQQWRDWYQSLQDEGGTATDTTTSDSTQTLQAQDSTLDTTYLNEPENAELRKYLTELQSTHASELTAMREELKSVQEALRSTTDQTSRMFNYHAQLNELGEKYPKLNKQELLDHALKNGQPDLERAYKDLHQDELIDAEVEKRLEARINEARTKGIRGPGQKVIFQTPKNTPKTFGQATESILDERASAGL